MRRSLVCVVLFFALGSVLDAQQTPRRLEFGALFGATEIGRRSRVPGESGHQPYVGVRADARVVRIASSMLGVAAFWDSYRYDEVVFNELCDPGPCAVLHDLENAAGLRTGRSVYGNRLGGGLTWQVPLAGQFRGDVGVTAGRFARTDLQGFGFAELTDKSLSRSFLGAEAGVTRYWRSVALGIGYDYEHAWRVHGRDPIAHRVRLRLAYTRPYT